MRALKRTLGVALIALGVVLGTAGCTDKGMEQFKDAPIGQRNMSKADLVNFPDGFSNVASKCDGPNRVYTAFKGDSNRAAIAVVAGDPRCKS